MSFTVVFPGSIRKIKANPLTTETPLGIGYAAGIGDIMAEAAIFRDALERIEIGLGDPAEVAAEALETADAAITAARNGEDK